MSTSYEAPPEIERLIAQTVEAVIHRIESCQHNLLWNSHIYTRLAFALLEEARCGLTEAMHEKLASNTSD